MAMKTYLDFAENDYKYFKYSCNSGFVANAMAAQAQEICEKYMKHIIDTYHKPVTSQEEQTELEGTMRSHNLLKLQRYMENHTDFSFHAETKRLLRGINGYYFSARYPGDESLEVTQEDIDLCLVAVETCRDNILEILREAEMENIPENNMEEDMER